MILIKAIISYLKCKMIINIYVGKPRVIVVRSERKTTTFLWNLNLESGTRRAAIGAAVLPFPLKLSSHAGVNAENNLILDAAQSWISRKSHFAEDGDDNEMHMKEYFRLLLCPNLISLYHYTSKIINHSTTDIFCIRIIWPIKFEFFGFLKQNFELFWYIFNTGERHDRLMKDRIGWWSRHE